MIRRDFLNQTLLAAGASLLQMPAPAAARDQFTGYGGVGDYAASNGDPWPVLSVGHKLAQGAYTPLPKDVQDTGESFDVLVVGGGLSGLGTAYYVDKVGGGKRRCLILENHPMFGGHCKQNEFVVQGQRLFGPQASNDFGIPAAGSGSQMDELFTELKLPREYEFAAWDASLKPMRFPRDNYSHMDGINDTQVDIAYYFGRQAGSAKAVWARNLFVEKLAGTPFSEAVKRDLLKWRATTGGSEEVRRHLDAISYKQYLEGELGLSAEVTKFVEPVVGLICGASADAVCARAAHNLVIPANTPAGISFPGGNTTFARHLVRALIPEAIPAETSLGGVQNSNVNFAALDREGAATRIRLGATVIQVEHATGGAVVTYEKGGKLYRTRAAQVVMASPGWLNRHVLADLPGELRGAYGEFHYAPALSVNVALTNWRFLYRVGAAAVRYFNEGFGWSCNIRRPMIAGTHKPELHPDKPALLTFYTGLATPGRTVAEQGELGRKKMLGTTYAAYEKQIRAQMETLFHDAGFRASRDLAGIVLNRWGHARVVQPPGFYYGTGGKPAAREIVQKGYGRIAIAHSELNGHQNATGALQQGKRAASVVLG